MQHSHSKITSIATACRIAALVFSCGLAVGAGAEEIPFVPLVYNYNAADMGDAGNQNWAVAQGSGGVIYIGNNSGLLAFDGTNWTLWRLPNKLSVKSIFVDSATDTERIYVGSFEEFGYFEADSTNQFVYHSLKPLVKDYTFRNDEIWTIHKQGGILYFQTFSSYFAFDTKENTIRAEKPAPGPLYFFGIGENMYAQFIGGDFCSFDEGRFSRLLPAEQINGDVVVAALSCKGDLLLASSENGIYKFDASNQEAKPWKTEIDDELETSVINRAICISDSLLVVGTLNNGLFFINADGSLKWHLHRKNGLNNNTILGIFCDKEENIWVALDNGISYIRANSGLSFFEPEDVQLGLVEDILLCGNDCYMATNQGVYKYLPGKNTMFLLPGFEVQSWFIRRFGDQIISGNNAGTSFVENDKNVHIPTSTGATDIKPALFFNRDVLIGSTYTALSIFRKNAGKWVYANKAANFSDLINQLEIDHTGNIWAGHMYKGVYRLRLNDKMNAVSEQQYFARLNPGKEIPSPIKVMKLRGRIVLCDANRFYTYNDISHQITAYHQLNDQLKGLEDVNRIIPVNDTLFWFVRDNEYVLVDYLKNNYRIKERIPFSILNNPPNSERGNVYVSDNGISYLTLNGGIARYAAQADSATHNPDPLRIRSAKAFDNKSGQFQHLHTSRIAPISYANNSLSFEFRYTDFSRKKVTIECYLENYDNRWIATDKNFKIEYINLPAAEYTLRARAINDVGVELSALSIAFRVKNPWYKTAWAIIFYSLILTSAIFLLTDKYTKRVIKRKNAIFAQQEKDRLAQLDKQEKLITALKNKQLESELTYKSKELSGAIMNIINQKEFLNLLKNQLQTAIRFGKVNKTEGQKMLALINGNIAEEGDWAMFQENFDLIHDNFFRKLQSRFPSLTPSDLKICALLRLNYSSKDISRMLNLTIRGVEAARYRLRKKLQLSEDENLVSFMIDFR